MMVAGTWRGQPLAALVLIVGAWIAVRAIMWQAGIVEPPAVAEPSPRGAEPMARPAPLPPPAMPPQPAMRSLAIAPRPATGAAERHPDRFSPPVAPRAIGPAGIRAPSLPPELPLLPIPLPVVPSPAAQPPISSGGPEPTSARHERRWSGDSWFMLRGGGDGSLAAGGGSGATYGASQAGAVLRYRLVPGSGYRPAAYLRATAALNGSDEREAALGISARPIAAVPVVASVELRAAQRSGGVRLRPAALIVSELPVMALPAALQAEAYVQAGYVGGEFATAFVDGQVRVDRSAGAVGRARLSLGAAAWGGAQKGVARLDLGPAMRIAVPLGEAAAARIGVDWRLRVAGNAAPSSGPALTLSAGF